MTNPNPPSETELLAEDDLVYRLREWEADGFGEIFKEAADEIQRLRAHQPKTADREAIARVIFDQLPGDIVWEDHNASHIVPFDIADAILALFQPSPHQPPEVSREAIALKEEAAGKTAARLLDQWSEIEGADRFQPYMDTMAFLGKPNSVGWVWAHEVRFERDFDAERKRSNELTIQAISAVEQENEALRADLSQPPASAGEAESVAWLDLRTANLSWQNRIVATNPQFVVNNGPQNFVALYAAPPSSGEADEEADEFGYAELGRSFYEEYERYSNDGTFKGFVCAASPVEILVHLINERDEARASSGEGVRAAGPRDDEILAAELRGSTAEFLGWLTGLTPPSDKAEIIPPEMRPAFIKMTERLTEAAKRYSRALPADDGAGS